MPPKTERFELRIEEALLGQVEGWAEAQPDRPARAEAIRRLIDIGLSVDSKQSVRFSDGEKLLMLMMKDLFQSLNVKDPEIRPDFLADVIYGGHYWAPKWEMNGVFHDHVDNPLEVRFVVDVLDMWDFIEAAAEKLTAEEQKKIAAEAGPWGGSLKFPGFDGNNESEQLSIAEFLVSKMGRFQRFKSPKRSFNSHCPTYDSYLRMLNIFEGYRQKLVGRGLTAAELIIILSQR
jgi:uncharacterized protein YfbU (UPF0304 family)